MSQDDLTVANASGATVRADINANLQALGSVMAGAAAPGTTYAYMLWADTANTLLKQRNAANDGWVTLGTLLETFASLATVQQFTATISWDKGADVASASPLLLNVGDGNYFDVTGSVAITSMTVAAGTLFALQFDAAPTLTHHATNLNLPGAANMTMAAGDILVGFATAANQVKILAPPARAAGVPIITGKHTEYYDATAFKETVSNGCDALDQLETTAGRPDINYMAFDGAADEHAQVAVVPPKKWNGGTVTFRVHHTHPAAIATGVAWALQGVAIVNSGTIDVAYGTAVVVVDTYLNAAEDLHVTPTSGAVTIGGTPAGGGDEFVVFRVFRDVSDGTDDTATDAYFLGLEIDWTLNGESDA